MIAKLDIARFGLFKDYTWNNSIGGGQEDCFTKMNVIYGRNYSGKTTLSRILRCVERKQLHENYQDAQFTITVKGNHQIASNSLGSFTDELQVRVYNSDFVRDNLSWLHNSDGTIKPFTILGAKNVDIDKKIKEIDDKIGSVEAKKGIIHEQAMQSKVFDDSRKKLDEAKSDLENKLRTKAQQIKNATSQYNVPTYNISSIKNDISRAKEFGPLSDAAIEDRRKSLRDEPKASIAKLSTSFPDMARIHARTKKALSTKIAPSQPIADLVNDHLLQEWVRNGIDKHRGKRDKCAFCGNPLPHDLWEKLDVHFNKESESLRKEIASLLTDLKRSHEEVQSIIKLNKDSFYNSLHASFDDILNEWGEEMKLFDTNVEHLMFNLSKRIDDIFHEINIESLSDNSESMKKKIFRLNELIDHNNQKTSTLASDQRKIQEELRLSEVAKYVSDIQFDGLVEKIKQFEGETSKAEAIKNDIDSNLRKLAEEKRSLELQMQDESKGAALVNQHLSQFFGHDELKLVPDGKKPNMKFKITRENTDAKNLSEGECSLISFCYFIAKIEDELKDQLAQNKLIIYIDDPISSLDGNHIFFMFSLIESIIAKPKKYAQLFISTHNLDFFKYIKRLTTPDGKNSVSYFLIERRQKKNERKSFLIRMPAHLRDYVTEFNYLFNEIFKVYKAVNGDRKQQIDNSYNQFYNLPNNLRKFLECYLFFRFPNNGNPLDNLPKLFDNHIPALINRVVHEYSHLTYIDRGWMPMDVGEAEECAKLVIEKIKEKDKEQFEALVASIS